MYDDEEECMMNERYVELANAQRNLTESELSELKTLREKIDMITERKRKQINGFKKQLIQNTKDIALQCPNRHALHEEKHLAKRFKKGDLSEAEVDMKMGPSYKVVQPTLAKTSEPDFFPEQMNTTRSE